MKCQWLAGESFMTRKSKMKMYGCLGLIGLVLISGCGELSYKRGATADDLESARKSCRSAGDETAAEKCLEDRGWVVKKLDDLDLFATAGVSPDNRSLGIDQTTHPPLQAAGTGSIPPETPRAAPSGTGKQPAAVDNPSPRVPPPPAHPLDTYTVSSWWKMGAGREAMETNTTECLAELGEAHRPNQKTQQVTRGFVVCMHGKGWRALRAK